MQLREVALGEMFSLLEVIGILSIKKAEGGRRLSLRFMNDHVAVFFFGFGYDTQLSVFGIVLSGHDKHIRRRNTIVFNWIVHK
jgi:hypothetical protein